MSSPTQTPGPRAHDRHRGHQTRSQRVHRAVPLRAGRHAAPGHRLAGPGPPGRGARLRQPAGARQPRRHRPRRRQRRSGGRDRAPRPSAPTSSPPRCAPPVSSPRMPLRCTSSRAVGSRWASAPAAPTRKAEAERLGVEFGSPGRADGAPRARPSPPSASAPPTSGSRWRPPGPRMLALAGAPPTWWPSAPRRSPTRPRSPGWGASSPRPRPRPGARSCSTPTSARSATTSPRGCRSGWA